MDPLPPPPSDSPGPLPSQPTAPGATPGGGRRWLILGLVVVLVTGGIAAAVALSGGSDTTAGEPSASPSLTGPLQPNPPADLKASAGAFKVKLTWRTGIGEGAPADHYDILRGAKVVGHAEGDATSFLDDTAQPKQSYDYQVIAISAEGTDSETR